MGCTFGKDIIKDVSMDVVFWELSILWVFFFVFCLLNIVLSRKVFDKY